MIYELIYIIPNQYSENEAKEINAKVKDLAAQEGFEIMEEEKLEKKKLSYAIKHFFYGYYLSIYLKASEKASFSNLRKKLKTMPEIIRHQIIKYKKIPKKIVIPQEEKSGVLMQQRVTAEESKPLEKEKVLEQKDIEKSEKKVDLAELDKKIDELLENVDR